MFWNVVCSPPVVWFVFYERRMNGKADGIEELSGIS